MRPLSHWMRGPFELLRHAEGHLAVGSDFDRRMALISFDNAIEAAITAYLELDTKIRGGKSYGRDERANWGRNYHTKLEFLERLVSEKAQLLSSPIGDIIWFHTIRNELYHSGNGVVPEMYVVAGIRQAALEVFSVLFDVDAEQLLIADTVPPPESATLSDNSAVTTQVQFLSDYVYLERLLERRTGWGSSWEGRWDLLEAWNLFASEFQESLERFSSIVSLARETRDAMAHLGFSKLTELELKRLTSDLHEVINFVEEDGGRALDLLPILQERYGSGIRSDIAAVRVLKADNPLTLEVEFQSTNTLKSISSFATFSHYIYLNNSITEDELLMECINPQLLFFMPGPSLFTEDGLRIIEQQARNEGYDDIETISDIPF